jgi:HEAT repeat protein
VWSHEHDGRVRRRLQEIVIGFGARGRQSVQELMNAADWEVRRAAVYLLREFGDQNDLPQLNRLLRDSDPRVRREAIQTIALTGVEDAFELVVQAVMDAAPDVRRALAADVLELRDERAAPLFCYLLANLDHRRSPRSLYVGAIEALGRTGGGEAVRALGAALHRGSWMAPFRTKVNRQAAAAALARIGTPAALQVLTEASVRGVRDVRVTAKAYLDRAKKQVA